MRLQGIILIALLAILVGCGQAVAQAPTPVPTTALVQTPAAAQPQAQSPAQKPASGTPGANPRVTGVVKSVDGGKITLADGVTFTTTAQTRVTRMEPLTPNDLKTGQYVAVTAKRQTDNTLLASMINVFDDTLRGVAPGQRPLPEGNLMTNATIDKIENGIITVVWEGGGALVKLAPDAKLAKIAVLPVTDLKEGMNVSIGGANGVAQSVSIQ